MASRYMPEKHTAMHIEQRVLEIIAEWGLESASSTSIPVTSDSASNMRLAFSGANWEHVHCIAHTLQLCLKEALDKPKVRRALGWACKVVSYFHCSPLATIQLRKKIAEMQLPQVKLKQEIATWWNSAHAMIKTLEGAVTSVLATSERRHLQVPASDGEDDPCAGTFC